MGMADSQCHGIVKADEAGLSCGQLVEVIHMLQSALRHAGAQARQAASAGWRWFEGEESTVAIVRHQLSVAKWKYYCDVVYEDDSQGSYADLPEPVLPDRVATPQPSGFRAESYEWARYMSEEDLTTLHSRLAHSNADFSLAQDMDCLTQVSFYPI